MIRLAAPAISEDEIQGVADVLRSGFLVQGQHVRDFERLVAECVGVQHAVAVSSGTAALHLALLALGIGPGDEVLVPDFSFAASANVVERTGARAVLIDIEGSTYNLDARLLAGALTPRTRAIMPVHLFGLPADMDPVLHFAGQQGLLVIEDAACASGARYRGRACGSLGSVGCFSFHARKIVTTGEGGMLTTNDAALADRLRSLRNHGLNETQDGPRFTAAGLNYRLTDFQGVLGSVQMRRLAGTLDRRERLVQLYREQLDGRADVCCPVAPDDCQPVWQAFVVQLHDSHDRDRVRRGLFEQGVESAIGTYSISAQPAYADRGYDCPVAQRAYRQCLGLPLHDRLTDDEVDFVSRTLLTILDSEG